VTESAVGERGYVGGEKGRFADEGCRKEYDYGKKVMR
jgi:hypothetical protein